MRWHEATWQEIDALDRNRTIVALPVGSVEQHGHHMPLGTDSMLASAVTERAASLSDLAVVVLPTPWYGLSAHHMKFPGSVTLTCETMMAVVSDIVAATVAHGFRRVTIVNGHGGNAGVIDILASILGHRFYGKARIVSLSYFTLPAREIAEIRESEHGGTGHACEFETSLMLAIDPRLVHTERAVVHYPDPGSTYLSTDLGRRSQVSTFLSFDDLSESGTFGDPGLASAEKGERFLEACSQALADFFADFVEWPIPGRTK